MDNQLAVVFHYARLIRHSTNSLLTLKFPTQQIGRLEALEYAKQFCDKSWEVYHVRTTDPNHDIT